MPSQCNATPPSAVDSDGQVLDDPGIKKSGPAYQTPVSVPPGSLWTVVQVAPSMQDRVVEADRRAPARANPHHAQNSPRPRPLATGDQLVPSR